jgi:hypothetical protein
VQATEQYRSSHEPTGRAHARPMTATCGVPPLSPPAYRRRPAHSRGPLAHAGYAYFATPPLFLDIFQTETQIRLSPEW